MSIIGNESLAGASGQGGYTIERSLRFRGATNTPYMTRTFGSGGNRKTWTYSIWFKRGKLGSIQTFFTSTLGGAGVPQAATTFNSNDTFNLSDYTGSAYTFNLTTSQVFRDPSAWYHIVFLCDTTNATSSDRVRLYINGSRVTAFSTASYPSQNADCAAWNNTYTHYIGHNNVQQLDGYLTETNFIDGQALDPSYFGETDTDTGAWIAKQYTGSYGTTGYYLNFSDNTSTTTLGYDQSSNSNNWTLNNFSLTAGSTYDSMQDVPTLTSASAGNYATLNPLNLSGGTFTNGNLDWASPGTDGRFALSSISATSLTKSYCEFTMGSKTGVYWGVGLMGNSNAFNPRLFYRSDGATWIDGTQQGGSWASYTQGDVIGIAFDSSTNQVSFYKNNSFQGTLTAATTGVNYYFGCASDFGGGSMNYTANFGQRPFTYTPPTGFKALNTYNLPDSTVKDGGDYFNTVLYTGNGSTQSITGVGFQPDVVWIKGRSYAEWHALHTSLLGTGKPTVLVYPTQTAQSLQR